jgi:hypothetical protein
MVCRRLTPLVTIFLRPLAFNHGGEALHVLVPMGAKAHPRCGGVFVDDEHITASDAAWIVILVTRRTCDGCQATGSAVSYAHVLVVPSSEARSLSLVMAHTLSGADHGSGAAIFPTGSQRARHHRPWCVLCTGAPGAPGPAMRALCGASEGLRAVVRPGGAQRPGLLRVCPQEHAVDGARR